MDVIEYEGASFEVRIEPDDFGENPWASEDGHGPVSDWTTRDKLPGEVILAQDGRYRRFYDFAEACKIARKDGWGFLPGKLETAQLPDGSWLATCQPRTYFGRAEGRPFTGAGADINRAISAVYAAHRATMTARQYAAKAALRDYDWLRRFCDGYWMYVVVTVELLDNDGAPMGETESLGGVESEGDHVDDIAKELAAELLARLQIAA